VGGKFGTQHNTESILKDIKVNDQEEEEEDVYYFQNSLCVFLITMQMISL
jgi:hypothetical protein